ncbi:hypothetical protein [Flavobacterium sp.]|uniref:hypothetical protein n=1 Tax=Flavobacterium sp. TaxID=239 RepID=UPI0037504B1E
MNDLTSLEKRKKTNLKILKILGIPALVLFLILIIGSISQGAKPKTKAEIEQQKKDSIQTYRVDKINSGFVQFEIQIKDKMKNPNSYDKILEDYNKKDTSDIVNMYIRFRGDNSLGGKSISQVNALYNIKTEDLVITNQSVE